MFVECCVSFPGVPIKNPTDQVTSTAEMYSFTVLEPEVRDQAVGRLSLSRGGFASAPSGASGIC